MATKRGKAKARNVKAKAKQNKALTPNQKEWAKIISNIRKNKASMIKRGYIFPSDYAEPQRPKRVRQKDLQALREYSRTGLYERSFFPSPETGELKSGFWGKSYEASQRGKKAAQTRKLKAQKFKGKSYKFNPETGETLEDERVKRSGDYFVDTETGEVISYEPLSISDVVLSRIEDMLENWTPNERWSPKTRAYQTEQVNQLANILQNEIDRVGRNAVASRLEDNAEDVVEAVSGTLYGYEAYRVSKAISQFVQILKGGALDLNESANLTDLAEQHYGYESV